MRNHILQAFFSILFITIAAVCGIYLCIVSQSEPAMLGLSKNPSLIYKWGISLICFSLVSLVCLFIANRKSYYQVRLEPNLKVFVSPKILKKGISAILKESTSGKRVPFNLNVYGSKIELIADLSRFELKEHGDILSHLEPRLNDLFERTYGCAKELAISVLTYPK